MITSFTGEHRYLSNFYPAPVTWSFIWADGVLVPTAEHLYQALKAGNEMAQRWVLDAESPGEAKRRGRHVPLDPRWEMITSVKKKAMFEVVWRKFDQHSGLAARLHATGSGRLIEGNTWHDNYWGSCICARCAGSDPAWWGDRGHNYLGKILMTVRELSRLD